MRHKRSFVPGCLALLLAALALAGSVAFAEGRTGDGEGSVQPESGRAEGVENVRPDVGDTEGRGGNDSFQDNARLEGLAPDIAGILERGTLRVAIPHQDLEAFFQEEADGSLSGIDIELAQGIAASLGVEAVFDRTAETYEELTKKLKNNEVDLVIATYSHSLDRIQYVDFSRPYLELKFGIMVNKQAMLKQEVGDNPVPYLKENRERIAAVQGTSHVELAKKLFGACEIVEAKDYDSATQMVQTGEVFGFFCGELEFYSKYLAQPDLRIYTDTYVFSDVKDEFCVGVTCGEGQLLDYVNLYIATSEKITVEDVQERYRAYYGAAGE